MKIPWLVSGQTLPPASSAQGSNDAVPGLLAAGGSLDIASLHHAYSNASFPWFSEDQPILWWSPDPRMVLDPNSFVLHHSLKKTLQRFRRSSSCEIRIDHAFDQVMEACSSAPRDGQSGTWINSMMLEAYGAFHRAGFAHSVETWINGELAGGLYCVGIGRAVFGESMFARQSDASKIALAALVCFCLQHDIELIDCQQKTKHLASLGASEVSRSAFVKHVENSRDEPAPVWRFEPVYWDRLLVQRQSDTT